MHGSHEHDDRHKLGHAHAHHHGEPYSHATPSGYELRALAGSALGHNAPAAQWQSAPPSPERAGGPEPDFDLVEAAFAEGFPAASDPTSFLRLARIPFVGRGPDGRTLKLLRVEFEQVTDVGTVTPQLGGGALRFDPLPAQMVSTRRRLRFAYHDGAEIVRLSLAETRRLDEALLPTADLSPEDLFGGANR